MRRLRFIVNADDLGLDNKINAAIEHCMVARRITSASILANGPAFEEGVAIAKRNPHISIGVHLNATEFAPVSGARLSPIMEKGYFNNTTRSVALRASLIWAIAEEFEAQIAKVRAVDLTISHLDSHHHIHTSLQLFPIMFMIARKHGIRWIRPTRNIFRSGEAPTSGLRVKKWAWNMALSLVANRRARYFGSLLDFTDTDTSFPDGSIVEIMVHPGGTGQFVAESELLGSEWWHGHCDEATLEPYL
jgi:predicted glycoside hydrolase/deacetylase ChbG (UPF0249 family)